MARLAMNECLRTSERDRRQNTWRCSLSQECVEEGGYQILSPTTRAASVRGIAIKFLYQRLGTMTDYRNIPDYDNLPPVKGMPKGCAWGVFDKDGKDKFGTINLITPEVVKEAVKGSSRERVNCFGVKQVEDSRLYVIKWPGPMRRSRIGQRATCCQDAGAY